MPPLDAETLAAVARLLADRLDALRGVYLYGSQATGTATAASDVDLAVLGDAPFDAGSLFDARQDAERFLARDVDLIDLRRAPTVLQRQVLEGGRTLLGRDDAVVAAFEVFILRSYEDLQIRRRGIMEDIARRGSVYA